MPVERDSVLRGALDHPDLHAEKTIDFLFSHPDLKLRIWMTWRLPIDGDDLRLRFVQNVLTRLRSPERSSDFVQLFSFWWKGSDKDDGHADAELRRYFREISSQLGECSLLESIRLL